MYRCGCDEMMVYLVELDDFENESMLLWCSFILFMMLLKDWCLIEGVVY